ncbi:MAG: hypothetical protein E7514_01615 [Ruminococcaceae bacterium]|nr:hypothetical protein [Oscillospiraceae bacterium]
MMQHSDTIMKRIEAERKCDGRNAYLLSCDFSERKANQVIVQNHCYKAAGWHYSPAQVELGVLGLLGLLIDMDTSTCFDINYCPAEQGVLWLKESYKSGNKVGSFLYAKCLQTGLFTKEDKRFAESIFKTCVAELTEEDILMLNSIIDFVKNGYSPLDAIFNNNNVVTFPLHFRLVNLELIDSRYKKAM